MRAFVQEIQAAVAAATELAPESVRVETPRDAKMGDLAFPCFPLAKALKKAPPAIAGELAETLNAKLEGITAVATGPYLNFTIDRERLARTILGDIQSEGAEYGRSDQGEGKTVLIDLSSPNIAKPMHVGHLRSGIIGMALKRLHERLGYKTVGINHLGDWGIQFGKLCAAIARWGDTVDLETDPIEGLNQLYVRFHNEEENDPELAEAGRAAFRELESGADGEVRATWRKLTELSLREFDKVHARLGVEHELVRGEAFYEPYLEQTIERIEAAGVTEMSQGALIVDLEGIDGKMPPCLLRKTDGTTLYATRDMAAAFHRWEEFGFDRCLYVVGSDQKLHFRQLRAVLKKMGMDWWERVEHVPFGMMSLPEGKMSTRQNRTIRLGDVLDRATEEAKKAIVEKNAELANADEVAAAVGIGAVVFNDLKKERVKDVVFDWDEALAFQGDTGVYLMYTHARLCKIERTVLERGQGEAQPDLALLEDSANVLTRLGRFPDVVRSAAADCEPSELAQYLLGLAREVSAWYDAHRVLDQEPPLTAARLALVRAARDVLANGLGLLGIAAPQEM